MTTVGAIKIYGERNTGTNYVSALLGENIDLPILRGTAVLGRAHALAVRWRRVFSQRWATYFDEGARDRFFDRNFDETLGWKHTSVPARKVTEIARDRVGFVLLVKHPFAWALSLFRRPYHGGTPSASFAEFVQAPFPLHKRDGLDGDAMLPMAIWNEKVRSYFELGALTTRSIVIQYEDFLRDEPGSVARVATAFGTGVSDQITPVQKSTKGDDSTWDDYRAFYLEERWREKLSPADTTLLQSQTDGELAARCGYRVN